MSKPVLDSLSTVNMMGDKRMIIARGTYDGRQVEVTLHGTQTGKPGRVRAQVMGMEVPVIQPERYGTEFNEDWVRKYWDQNTTEKRDAPPK